MTFPHGLFFAIATAVAFGCASVAEEVVAKPPPVGSPLAELQLVALAPMRIRIQEVREKELVMRGPPLPSASFSFTHAPEGTFSLMVGDRLPETNFVITSITKKMRMTPKIGGMEDDSEVGVRNVRTGREFVARLSRGLDPFGVRGCLTSPDRKIQFVVQEGDELDFPPGQTTLQRYRAVEVKPTHVDLLYVTSGEIFRFKMKER